MKESYREDLASHSGLEPYAGDGNIAGVASARGNAGQPLSSEITLSRADLVLTGRRQHRRVPLMARCDDGRGGVEEPVHAWTFQAREPGDPVGFLRSWHIAAMAERSENVSDGNADMNANRKSDESIVPATPANNDALKRRRSRSRKGTQPRGTPSRLPCTGLRAGSDASHVDCTACVKLPARTASSSSLLCCIMSTRTVLPKRSST